MLDSVVIVMGGIDSSSRLTQYMHEYNPATDRWSVFGEMPRPLKSWFTLNIANAMI